MEQCINIFSIAIKHFLQYISLVINQTKCNQGILYKLNI